MNLLGHSDRYARMAFLPYGLSTGPVWKWLCWFGAQRSSWKKLPVRATVTDQWSQGSALCRKRWVEGQREGVPACITLPPRLLLHSFWRTTRIAFRYLNGVSRVEGGAWFWIGYNEAHWADSLLGWIQRPNPLLWCFGFRSALAGSKGEETPWQDLLWSEVNKFFWCC